MIEELKKESTDEVIASAVSDQDDTHSPDVLPAEDSDNTSFAEAEVPKKSKKGLMGLVVGICVLCAILLSFFLIKCPGNPAKTETISQKTKEPAGYDPRALFHDGLAAVEVDGKWGYIN